MVWIQTVELLNEHDTICTAAYSLPSAPKDTLHTGLKQMWCGDCAQTSLCTDDFDGAGG